VFKDNCPIYMEGGEENNKSSAVWLQNTLGGHRASSLLVLLLGVHPQADADDEPDYQS